MPLTQVEHDLHRYMKDKLYNLMRDVVQASRIAEQPDNEVRAMLGSTLMHMSATLALHGDMSKQWWMRLCLECWDRAAAAKEESPE